MIANELHRNSQNECPKGRKRPSYLRALGNKEPPMTITIDGKAFERIEIYKHDSWAATATYGHDKSIVVCKFNRVAPVFGIPMRWCGRVLGSRETYFLKRLAGVSGIPKCFEGVQVDGKLMRNVAAHEFIFGQPLSLNRNVRSDFFEKLEELIGELHARRIAYVDLHKAENVIVGEDGLPYLIDFQISVTLPQIRGLGWIFQIFAKSDLYHLEKHRLHTAHISTSDLPRPWWIRLHRRLTIPMRNARRRFLVLIEVRRGQGYSSTESTTEVGLRR